MDKHNITETSFSFLISNKHKVKVKQRTVPSCLYTVTNSVVKRKSFLGSAKIVAT